MKRDRGKLHSTTEADRKVASSSAPRGASPDKHDVASPADGAGPDTIVPAENPKGDMISEGSPIHPSAPADRRKRG